MEALLTGAPLTDSGDNQGTSQDLLVDSNPHVYLNRGKKVNTGNSKALGTSKPLLIPDSIDYGADPFDEQETASSSSTSVFVRSLKGRPKLESVTIAT